MTNNNDIADDVLAQMRNQTIYPETLDAIVALSRKTFGWYTKHALRCIEYPWIVERCRSLGDHVLDVGAGVSPVPVFLATRENKKVVTVDYNSSVVAYEAVARRNEWGFLDYSVVDPSMSSHNVDISDFKPEQKFDVIYSISVIEHMPAEIRRKMVGVFGEVAAPNADVLLTIDLYGASMDLWNHDRGEPVEPRETHGSLRDVTAEFEALGFETRYLEILRRSRPDTPGDLAMLHMARRV